MAQLGKKNLNLFRALRKEQAEKAKNAWNTKVPNLQESLVDVHNGSKRKASAPIKHGVGKELKKVMSMLLGLKSSSRTKKPEA
ncbi:hypothetical protein DEO72_LG5g2065 [Vigna unguiculata]|uniref:Uncharacterized protein n=1 Tax=Vigna unguiculata TaxID=3917 RepID=A0A4D6LZ89_VIGUN|nr:hypothetical protein DEO72_LG5g2065 [Vigna unguiculata]